MMRTRRPATSFPAAIAAAAALLVMLWGMPARAADRLALVIGNAAYRNVPVLANPVHDAKAIAARLNETGFKTTLVADATRIDMVVALQNFLDGIKGGDEIIVYYAGHGVEVGGANYMLPVDVPALRAGQERLLRSEGLNLNDLMSDLDERKARVSVLILDACRDNPFPRAGSRSLGSARGLSQTQPPEGVFVMYSAGPGQTALDNLGPDDRNPNGLFTRVLLQWITRENVGLRTMAVALRDEVQRMARDIGHAQRPGYYDGMNGEFFFRAAAASRPAAQPQPVSAGVAPPTAPAPTTATAAPPASPGPPPTFSADDISYVTPASRGVIKRVTDSSPNWSLAVHERGGYWWVSHLSGDQAARDAHALASCEFQAGDPCFLYARNRQTVAAASGAQKNVSMLIESGPLNPQLAPNLVPATFGRVESYARTSGSKALAIHPNGSIGISYAEPVAEAQRLALAACNEQAKNQWNRPCLLYAVGNDVVLHRRSANPIR